MKISIAIPTYECHGNGWLFMSELLNSIHKQTYKNVEIVISDQSIDDKIKNIINFYSSEMDIKYIEAKEIPRKIGSNLNNALKYCNGDIIKTMMADDFFIDNSALQKIKNVFDNDKCQWLSTGFCHCDSINFMKDTRIPFYTENIHLGNNNLSSPSGLSMRKVHFFDENLSILIDCEMYKRLNKLYGKPSIITDILYCNRLHENQMGNKLNKQVKEDSSVMVKEQQHCINLYGS